MKTILSIFLIVFSVQLFALTPEERVVVSQMRDTVNSLRVKLTDAQLKNDTALNALSESALQMSSLMLQAQKAAESVAALTNERDNLKDDLASSKLKYDKLNVRYQRAQLIIAIFTAFFVGLIVLQFTHNLQPPYGLLVPVVAGAAAFITIYFIL
jgi:hypothetical protein